MWLPLPWKIVTETGLRLRRIRRGPQLRRFLWFVLDETTSSSDDLLQAVAVRDVGLV